MPENKRKEHEATKPDRQHHQGAKGSHGHRGRGSPRGRDRQKGSEKRRASPGPPSRESTLIMHERQEKERRNRMFEFWQTLKEDLRDQELERLQEKVALQHELIRAQDERNQQRKDREQRQHLKKREKEKAERRAQTEALQEICRQSLEEDRRQAAEKRQAARQEKVSVVVSKRTILDDPAPLDHRDVTELSNRTSLASARLSLPHPEVAGDDGYEPLVEEEEEAEDGAGSDDIIDNLDDSLPWHHLQLYRLYGKHADYYLHPKIETEKKAPVQLNPRLQAIGGRAGAGMLWDVLRTESRARLLKQDNKLLSPELKSTFGAFAREGLSKKRQPVRRNFLSSEDVPDLVRLMDQSRVYQAQDFRHKVELMFRSSNINQDRTKVLLYNNPPPDLNNLGGEDSVERYLPSWADMEQWDKQSEQSYKKWLQRKTPTSQKSVTDQSDRPSSADAMEEKETPRNRKSNRPKYVFLTEEAATCKGEFSQKRKEMLENRERPQPHRELKAASAMAAISSEDIGMSNASSPRVHSSRRRPHTDDLSQSYVSQWQPLDVNALIEYKQHKGALGQGDFNYGKTAVWATGQ